MKLSLFYTDLCLKQFLENATAGRNSRCSSVVDSASCELRVAASADCSFSRRFKVA